MQRIYEGLPAAPSVEQAIIRAQLLILKTYEREASHLLGAPRLSQP
jgi:hypothetical protein